MPDDAAQKKPPTRAEEIKFRRADLAYLLSLRKLTTVEVGEQLGVKERQARALIALGKERARADLRNMEGRAGIIKQFMTLEYALDEAIAAFERSKQPEVVSKAQTTRERDGAGIDGPGAKTKTMSSKQTKVKNGDPQYLHLILKASEQQRQLLGLDAATVQRLLMGSDPGANAEDDDDIRSIPTDQLLARYRKAVGIGSELE